MLPPSCACRTVRLLLQMVNAHSCLLAQGSILLQANVGNYETSARFYIRALSMNPKASSTWGYLRTSLACSGRMDLMELVHESNLDALQKELPL